MKELKRYMITEILETSSTLVTLTTGEEVTALSLRCEGTWGHGQFQRFDLMLTVDCAEALAEWIGENASQAKQDVADYKAAEAAVDEATADVDISPLNASFPELIVMLTAALQRRWPGNMTTAGLAWARGDLRDHLPYNRQGVLTRVDLVDSLTVQELRGLVVRARAMVKAWESK